MWKTGEFWIAVTVAILIKLTTSRKLRPFQVASTILISVGAAHVGSAYVSIKTGLPDEIAAALLALTAEELARWAIKLANDPREAISLLKQWRGRV